MGNIKEKSLVSSEEIKAHLKTWLTSAEKQQQERSYQFLSNFGDDHCVSVIKNTWAERDITFKSQAMKLLLAINSDYALKTLVEHYFFENLQERRELHPIMAKSATRLFTFLLNLKKSQKHSPVMQAEIHSLLQDDNYFSAIKTLLTYPDDKVILYGLRQVYKYPAPELLSNAEEYIKHRNWQLRYNAYMVMTRVNNPAAREIVLQGLKDPIDKIQNVSANHIAVNLEEYRDTVDQFLLDQKEDLLLKLLPVLSTVSPPTDLAKLLPIVDSNHPKLAPLAAETMEAIINRYVKSTEKFETEPGFIHVSHAIIELTAMERNKEVTHQIRNILKTTGKAAIVLLLENFRGNELIERSILSDYLKGIDFFFTEKVFSAVSQTTEQCYTRYLRMIITFYGQKGFDLIFQHLDTLAVEQLLKTGETLLAMNVDKKIIKDRYKKFLQSTNNEKRDAAYKVIAKCGGAEVLPALKKDIESEQKDKVATAIQALGYFKGLEALKLLTATYWQENYQQWRPNILHALSLRQEPDVLNQFLLLLEEEEPKGKIAVVEKLIEHRLTAYQLDSGFFSTMDYAKTMPKILTNLENREISMLEQWLINSRRPSSLDFLHHISATLQLVPTNWKMTVIDAGIFLTAPAFLLMLDHTFRRESRKSIASAVTLLEKIALMPVLRILYPSLFADGGLSLNWLRKEKTNETNEILPISLILLFQGDPTITKQILQFMTETEDSNLFSALELYIESNAEMEFRNSAISVIGKLQTPEAREKLVALSSNKEHDLSKKARQVLDESREGELL